jgi:hypothetical protein
MRAACDHFRTAHEWDSNFSDPYIAAQSRVKKGAIAELQFEPLTHVA